MIEVSAPNVSAEVKANLRSELTKLAEEKKGDQMLFDLLNKVKEFTESIESPQIDTNQNTEEPIKIETPKVIPNNIKIPEIYGTDIVTDRKSVFQAHIGKIDSKEQVIFTRFSYINVV